MKLVRLYLICIYHKTFLLTNEPINEFISVDSPIFAFTVFANNA